MARYAGRSVGDLAGNCHALVVVDAEGLAIAALDEVDPRRASPSEIVGLGVGETGADELVESVSVPGADIEPVRLAHPQDFISVPSPTVLRAQGSDLLAWSDERREYLAISSNELAILGSMPHHKTMSAVASELSCEPEEISSAVGTLAMLGIISLQESSEPFEPVEMSEPDFEGDELELEKVEAEPEDSEPKSEKVEAEPDDIETEAVGESDETEPVDQYKEQEEHEDVEVDSAADYSTDEPAPEAADLAPHFEMAEPPMGRRRTRRLAKTVLRPGVRGLRTIVRRPFLSRLLAIPAAEGALDEQSEPEYESSEIDPAVELEVEILLNPETGSGKVDEEHADDEHADEEQVDLEHADDEHADEEQVGEGHEHGSPDEPEEPVAVAFVVPAGEESEIYEDMGRGEDEVAEEALSGEPEPETQFLDWNEVDARIPVYGVYHSPEHNANLGLAMIMAYARVHLGGSLNNVYDIRKARIDSQPMLDEIDRRGRDCVVLFSDYMWSIDQNLAVSAEVKRLVPNSLTVHGGPHAPKYPGDADQFFADNPHVDVVVRGEGELTVAAILDALEGGLDRSRMVEALGEVEGITFRVETSDGYRLVRTPDRERNADMSIFPSPYLTGEFDEIDPQRWRSATIETNRGCPYGCTFCDWGSATLSRIRKFPIERVKAEMEWLVSRGISEIFFADANFGIFAQDVEIAEYLAELKGRYGAPAGVICSFAKNTTKYTVDIVRAWVDAGLCAEGSVALQTTDETTLLNVRRSNIKIEKYDDLADEFRRLGLPIVTDLLMGLPGATVDSFKMDLQRCIDRDVTPRMMETVVLPNSPMNDPDYRKQFKIETDSANIVVSTSSYSRDDFDQMLRLRLLFRSFEHYGLLRHLFRWIQQEHEVRAVDLISDIDEVIFSDPHRFPLLTWVGRYFDLMTVPPGGWPPFYDEVVDLLGLKYGIELDSSLAVVIEVQEFLMPTRQRSFPAELDLEHDYVAWYQAASGVEEPLERPRLSDFGPGKLIVDDPAGVCDARLLRNHFSMRRLEACDNPFWVLNDWELRSELMRPMATAVPLLSN